jgi:hypothetical protein
MGQSPLDPLGMWRDMLNQWETGLNRMSNEAMQSGESAKFINQAMALSLRFQQGMMEMMARYLQSIGVPTRSDVLALGERLRAIEDKVQALSLAPAAAPEPSAAPAPEKPAAAESPPATPSPASGPRPPRTKKPPAPKQEKPS